MGPERQPARLATIGAGDAGAFDTATTVRALGVPVQVLRAWTLTFEFPRDAAMPDGRRGFRAGDVRALARELTCVGSPAAAIDRARTAVRAPQGWATPTRRSGAAVLPFPADRPSPGPAGGTPRADAGRAGGLVS